MKNLFLALTLCIAVSAASAAAPKIHVVMPVYNFGSVVGGFAVAHTFVLTNTGDEELRISGVTATCGCTTMELAKTSIAPGESVNLETLVSTVAGSAGTISKTLTVFSNDPDTPVLTLRITGQVKTAEPYSISVSDAGYHLYLLIDLRSAEAYDAHHFLGAINIPYEALADRLDDLPREAFIILYDAAFETSEAAALSLRDEGFHVSYALVGGLDGWVHRFGLKYVTNPADPYEAGPQVAYLFEQGLPQHLKLVDEFDSMFLVYVDVRAAEEYATAHIMGAISIPFGVLQSSADLLPTYTPVITYDQTGALGDQAALWMINNGFAGAQSMLGGLDEWIRQYGETYLFTGSL